MAVKKTQVSNKETAAAQLTVVLVRGKVKVTQPVKHTLRLLNLHHTNHCVVVENTPVYRGMIQTVKDYVTWGEINGETFQELVSKRGREYTGRITDNKKKYQYAVLEVNGKKYFPYFALTPPRRGYETKGIKVAYAAGGAVGYRGEKINDLLKRMM